MPVLEFKSKDEIAYERAKAELKEAEEAKRMLTGDISIDKALLIRTFAAQMKVNLLKRKLKERGLLRK